MADSTASTSTLLPGHVLSQQILAQARRVSEGEDELGLLDDPFPLILELSPLLRAPAESTSLARQALAAVCQHSSAKEVAMALEVRMSQLAPTSASDEDEAGAGSQVDGTMAGPGEVGAAGVAHELSELVGLYASTLVRVRAKRPSSFLRTAVDSILAAVDNLTAAGALHQPQAGTNNSGSPTTGAVDVLDAAVHFVAGVHGTEWVAKEQAECDALLQRLLCSAVASLHGFLDAGWAAAVFARVEPKYRLPGKAAAPNDSVTAAIAACWQRALDCAASLGLTPAKLYDLASAISTAPPPIPNSDDGDTQVENTPNTPDLPTSVGAYVLFAAHLASDPTSPSALPPPATALRHLFPLVHLGLSGSADAAPVSTDATLFWLWYLASSATSTRQRLDDGQIDALVPLVAPLAALSPDPATRFLAFRLVAHIVTHIAGSDDAQLMLLAELVGPDCPYNGMRVAAVGLVKEVLVGKFAAGTESRLLSPALLEELGGVLFVLEPAGLAGEAGEVGAEAWLAEHGRGTLEKLGLYYFLLARDKDNETGIRTPAHVATTREHLTAPLATQSARWLEALEAAAADDNDAAMQASQLLILQDSLNRIDDLVATL